MKAALKLKPRFRKEAQREFWILRELWKIVVLFMRNVHFIRAILVIGFNRIYSGVSPWNRFLLPFLSIWSAIFFANNFCKLPAARCWGSDIFSKSSVDTLHIRNSAWILLDTFFPSFQNTFNWHFLRIFIFLLRLNFVQVTLVKTGMFKETSSGWKGASSNLQNNSTCIFIFASGQFAPHLSNAIKNCPTVEDFLPNCIVKPPKFC